MKLLEIIKRIRRRVVGILRRIDRCLEKGLRNTLPNDDFWNTWHH